MLLVSDIWSLRLKEHPRKRGVGRRSRIWRTGIRPPMKGLNDDHITLSHNTSALHKELKMEKPRNEIIISLCNQTFMYRCEELLNESMEITASTLIDKFQELKILYVVS